MLKMENNSNCHSQADSKNLSSGINAFGTNIKLTAVIMASGHGKRFGSNKLLEEFRGKPLIESILSQLPKEDFAQVVVVSIYDEVLRIVEKFGYMGIKNNDTTDDTATTIKLGCENAEPESDGIMFFTGDQPLLKRETILSLINVFSHDMSRIVLPVCESKRGNPVIFPAALLEELSSLQQNGRGRDVIAAHKDLVAEVCFDRPEEFFDIDFKEDIRRAAAL